MKMDKNITKNIKKCLLKLLAFFDTNLSAYFILKKKLKKNISQINLYI